MRITYLLLCLVLLSGCTSTLLTAISAADIVSGITTGKTSTDNAVSAAIRKDCALHRFFKSEKICTDKLLDKMEKMPCDNWKFTEEDEPYCEPAKDLNRTN